MSVHDLTFSRYSGARTPVGMRFLVLTRYGLRRVFASKLFLMFFVAAFLPTLGFASYVYARYNLEFLALFNLSPESIPAPGAEFFRILLRVQFGFAFLATVFVAPALISADLRNNALPLFLSRPVSRWEYVGGKFAVLALVLSAITWVPAAVLLVFQTSLAGPGWLFENFRVAVGSVLGGALLVVALGCLGLAISALVRRKAAAATVLFGGLLVLSALAAMGAALFSSTELLALQLTLAFDRVWSQMLGVPAGVPFSAGSAWVVLVGLTVGCLFVLSRRVRATEVVS